MTDATADIENDTENNTTTAAPETSEAEQDVYGGIDEIRVIRKKALALPLPQDAAMLWADMTLYLEGALQKLESDHAIQALKLYRKTLAARDTLFKDHGTALQKTSCLDDQGRPSNLFRESVTLFREMIETLTDADREKSRQTEMQTLAAIHKTHLNFEARLHRIDTGEDGRKLIEHDALDTLQDEDIIVIDDRKSHLITPDYNHHWQVDILKNIHEKLPAGHSREEKNKRSNLAHWLRQTDLQIRIAGDNPSPESRENIHHNIYDLSQNFAQQIRDARTTHERNRWKAMYRAVNTGLTAHLTAQDKTRFDHLIQELKGSYNNPRSFRDNAHPSLLRRAWNTIKGWISAPDLRQAWYESHREKTLSEIMAAQDSNQATDNPTAKTAPQPPRHY